MASLGASGGCCQGRVVPRAATTRQWRRGQIKHIGQASATYSPKLCPSSATAQNTPSATVWPAHMKGKEGGLCQPGLIKLVWIGRASAGNVPNSKKMVSESHDQINGNSRAKHSFDPALEFRPAVHKAIGPCQHLLDLPCPLGTAKRRLARSCVGKGIRRAANSSAASSRLWQQRPCVGMGFRPSDSVAATSGTHGVVCAKFQQQQAVNAVVRGTARCGLRSVSNC